MKAFAQLMEQLILSNSRNRKIELIQNYFKTRPDPERGLVLALLTGELKNKTVSTSFLKKIVMERTDPVLYKLSYDYVGDTAETIALIWPEEIDGDLPDLPDYINSLNTLPKSKLGDYITQLLSRMSPNERWATIKLTLGALRVGVSARLAKRALAEMSGIDIQDIEEIWHGLSPPYTGLFNWLEGKSAKPDVAFEQMFHPMMLAHPIDQDKDFETLNPQDFDAEWKWDGIRVQISISDEHVRLFSRTGEDISHSFPDLTQNHKANIVLDGELLTGKNGQPFSFAALQKRLNRKSVSRKLLEGAPAFIYAYDILFKDKQDLRTYSFKKRRTLLEKFVTAYADNRIFLSPKLSFKAWDDLAELREVGTNENGYEGVMLKRKDAPYLPGRPKGYWYKWKRDPRFVDAILLYAQRGHGKRSSFYSDYTFGVWNGNQIVPIGKAYSGFTDAELKTLDQWVRKNTINKFGPVREVKKELVFEVAFDGMQESPRHKSGIALRFPRIHRIRWDKPINEVEHLEVIQKRFLNT